MRQNLDSEYDYETESYGIDLLDDGSLDTVVRVTHKKSGRVEVQRHHPSNFDMDQEILEDAEAFEETATERLAEIGEWIERNGMDFEQE
jgi:hypothetical protein